MRNVEESSLKEIVNNLAKSLNVFTSLNEFYEKEKDLDVASLQDTSFKKDALRLEEFSNILNILSSIAVKPFTLNKREEVIESSSKANGLSDEARRKTLQDSSLWKRMGNEILPEQVYYFQYYDELVTYENIFIVTLLETISSELDKYRQFYVSLLKTSSDFLPLNVSGDFLDKALKEVQRLKRKENKIKATSFYKRVSSNGKRIRNVIATNILLRNQKYNAAYRFYKSLIAYEDSLELVDDFARYYYILLLKELKNKGYKLRRKNEILLDKRKILLPSNLDLLNGDNHVSISYVNGSFLFQVARGKEEMTFLLKISPNEPFMPISENMTSIDYLSLWHYGYLRKEEVILFDEEYHTEKELLDLFLSSHLVEIEGSEEIYSRYCPVCRGDSLKESNNIFECEDCLSAYKLEKEKILFINRRRK